MAEKTSVGLQLRALSGNCPLWKFIPSCVIEAKKATGRDSARGQVPGTTSPRKEKKKTPPQTGLPSQSEEKKPRHFFFPCITSCPQIKIQTSCQPPGSPTGGLNQPVTSVKRVWSRPSNHLVAFPRPPRGFSSSTANQSCCSLHSTSNQIRPSVETPFCSLAIHSDSTNWTNALPVPLPWLLPVDDGPDYKLSSATTGRVCDSLNRPPSLPKRQNSSGARSTEPPAALVSAPSTRASAC